MNQPSTPAERIQRASEELAAGVPEYATASALIAIAQLLEQIANPYQRHIVGEDVTQ